VYTQSVNLASVQPNIGNQPKQDKEVRRKRRWIVLKEKFLLLYKSVSR
jgi:hypothetical protein